MSEVGAWQAQRLAKELRMRQGDALPVDVSALAQAHGVKVRLDELEPAVSGMLVIKDAQATIVVNGSHHPHRRRFTIAHELAHYFLHRSSSPVFIDAIYFRDEASAHGTKSHEIEANAFAAELLMPADILRNQCGNRLIDEVDDDFLQDLADTFDVSVQALTIRLTSLGLITA